MKKTIDKKKYTAPATEIFETLREPLMINIGSGETTPEESDANQGFFEEEENSEKHSFNVWDEL